MLWSSSCTVMITWSCFYTYDISFPLSLFVDQHCSIIFTPSVFIIVPPSLTLSLKYYSTVFYLALSKGGVPHSNHTSYITLIHDLFCHSSLRTVIYKTFFIVGEKLTRSIGCQVSKWNKHRRKNARFKKPTDRCTAWTWTRLTKCCSHDQVRRINFDVINTCNFSST